jgi:hypothetical protein
MHYNRMYNSCGRLNDLATSEIYSTFVLYIPIHLEIGLHIIAGHMLL